MIPLADLAMGTEWAQKTVTLQSKPRGCHVITKELYKQIPEIHEFEVGMANIWRASPPPDCGKLHAVCLAMTFPIRSHVQCTAVLGL